MENIYKVEYDNKNNWYYVVNSITDKAYAVNDGNEPAIVAFVRKEQAQNFCQMLNRRVGHS